MRKLLIGLLLLASVAWGVSFSTLESEGTLTVVGVATFQAALVHPVGAVGTPSIYFLGDANSGFYWVGADDIGLTAGGVQVAHYNATGLVAIGLNGPLGTVTPAAVIGTTVDGTDGTFTGDIVGGEDLSFGQDPPDLSLGYKDRSDYITWQDDFTDGVQALYDVKWNTAGVGGAGTNTPTVRPGWSELVTDVAAGNFESTVSVIAGQSRAYEPRFEAVVELTALQTQRFEIGFYIAANELVEVIYDTAQGPNWMLEVDDTTGVERMDSGIAVVGGTQYKLEIQADAAGAITWAVDDVAMPIVGLANVMTANLYSTRWMLTNIAAFTNTGAVDYVQIETRKQP